MDSLYRFFSQNRNLMLSNVFHWLQSALECRKNSKISGKANSSALTGVLSAKQGQKGQVTKSPKTVKQKKYVFLKAII